jgi:protocatechuate 3,4-dioxygenase alpha subunit
MFGFALLFEGCDQAVDPEHPDAVVIEGRVLDGDGEPVAYPDALVEVWRDEQWARSRTDGDGAYRFVVAKPAPSVIEGIGTEAPYLNVSLFARGLLRTAQTRVYFPEEEARNAADPTLLLVPEDRRDTLVGVREGNILRFDIHLQGDRETVFFGI